MIWIAIIAAWLAFGILGYRMYRQLMAGDVQDRWAEMRKACGELRRSMLREFRWFIRLLARLLRPWKGR